MKYCQIQQSTVYPRWIYLPWICGGLMKVHGESKHFFQKVIFLKIFFDDNFHYYSNRLDLTVHILTGQ